MGYWIIGGTLFLGLLIAIPSAESLPAGERRMASQTRPELHLGVIPRLAPPPEPVADPAEERHIETLISKLADTSESGPSLYPSVIELGAHFAPLQRPGHFKSAMVGTIATRELPAFVELVKLGPASLPALLKHLSDATPTRLTIAARAPALALGRNLDASDVNPYERAILDEHGFGMGQRTPLDHSYQIKIGDLCLAAVGQIVGRVYNIVVILPGDFGTVTSPIQDPELAQQVRAIWNNTPSTRMLFRSLLADFCTRAASRSAESLSFASGLQCAAALRLLYYFPKQTAPLVAGRLERLDVQGYRSTLQGYRKAVIANGLDADDFIKAVRWCKEPAVQRAIRRVYLRATDPHIKAESSQAIPQGP